jgi:hypothetical protein
VRTRGWRNAQEKSVDDLQVLSSCQTPNYYGKCYKPLNI